ncbi:hypothetical protein CYMTET_7070 [Cymbomonas tetramitiformis]|uniref:Uncharacterized protein n=1 Tax=Cymbomonas tetramitiformis TaxID=36881 RepID=A0AAE0LHU9_9CHLO|nr:hypothetical protein CYMTET_7070 [Cymbomonas tetramitiformis]
MLIEFQRLEEAIVEDMPRDLEGPTDDLVEEQCGLEELPESRKVRTKHLHAYIDLALRELVDMQRALARVPGIEQPAFDEERAAAAATSRKRRAVRQPSGSDGEDSESEERKQAAAKVHFGSLRTATDEELRRALDGSLAVKDITRSPDGVIVAEPEEVHVEDVTMASDDLEPEPAAGAPLPAAPVAAPAVPPAVPPAGTGVGFPFAGEEPDEPYIVENYVGDEHEEAMTAELAKEMAAGRIFDARDWLPREELREELAVAVERYQDGAYAESTQRSYDKGVKAFLTFCVLGGGSSAGRAQDVGPAR